MRRVELREVTGVDEIVLSLYAKGLTTGEISAHFKQIYGASCRRGGPTRPKARRPMTDAGRCPSVLQPGTLVTVSPAGSGAAPANAGLTALNAGIVAGGWR